MVITRTLPLSYWLCSSAEAACGYYQHPSLFLTVNVPHQRQHDVITSTLPSSLFLMFLIRGSMWLLPAPFPLSYCYCSSSEAACGYYQHPSLFLTVIVPHQRQHVVITSTPPSSSLLMFLIRGSMWLLPAPLPLPYC